MSAEILESFHRASIRNRDLLSRHQLEARVGEWLDCPVLKLDKPHWHNRGEVPIPGQIFFSIWQEGNGELNYNIHAFKLRNLKQYKLESRKFAQAFRTTFDASGWPNVSLDFGPQTLMQGKISVNPTTLDHDLDSVIANFCRVHHQIDILLDQRKPATC